MFIQKPLPDFLLEQIKKANPNFKGGVEDLYASSPFVEEGRVNTKVYFKGRPESGLTGSFAIKYTREDIANTFRGIFADVPSDAHYDVKNAVTELNKRYGTHYDHADFELERLPNTILLTAKADSYRYVGHIAIRAFYNLSELGEFEVVEDINQVGRSAKHYSYPLSFATLGELSKVLPGQAKTLTIASKALSMETLDPWSVSKKAGPYNLYGATIVFNGESTDTNRSEPLVLKIAVDPKYCTNFTGELTLYYSMPEIDE